MTTYDEQLVALRRKLHAYPEIGWSEFTTTAIVVDHLREYGFEVLLGEKVIKRDAALGMDPAVVEDGIARARQNGVSDDLLAEMDGLTGAVGVWDTGRPGPVIALRFDIDCNAVQETDDPQHVPNKLGFRSERKLHMHACGHDGHTSIGVAVARWVAENAEQLTGTIKLLFQPAEEGVRGGAPMAVSGVLDDATLFFGAHLGTLAESGEVVTAPYDFLSSTKIDVRFHGRSAHAGMEPEKGANAVAAAAHATTQMLGISRHGGGMSRINVGVIRAGEGRNSIPVDALLQVETRGSTAEINGYMVDRVKAIAEGVGAGMEVEVEVEKVGEATDLVNDPELVELIEQAAAEVPSITTITREKLFGASEDATWLGRKVQENGGQAAFVMIGTDRPGGHHQPTFDIDEASLRTGLDWFTAVLRRTNGMTV